MSSCTCFAGSLIKETPIYRLLASRQSSLRIKLDPVWSCFHGSHHQSVDSKNDRHFFFLWISNKTGWLRKIDRIANLALFDSWVTRIRWYATARTNTWGWVNVFGMAIGSVLQLVSYIPCLMYFDRVTLVDRPSRDEVTAVWVGSSDARKSADHVPGMWSDA